MGDNFSTRTIVVITRVLFLVSFVPVCIELRLVQNIIKQRSSPSPTHCL